MSLFSRQNSLALSFLLSCPYLLIHALPRQWILGSMKLLLISQALIWLTSNPQMLATSIFSDQWGLFALHYSSMLTIASFSKQSRSFYSPSLQLRIDLTCSSQKDTRKDVYSYGFKAILLDLCAGRYKYCDYDDIINYSNSLPKRKEGKDIHFYIDRWLKQIDRSQVDNIITSNKQQMAKSKKKASSLKCTKRKAVSKVKVKVEAKLPRGYKYCGSCHQQLNIHKHVCGYCGFKHDMNKKKIELAKAMKKITPKIVRSMLELDEFNGVGADDNQLTLKAAQNVLRKRSSKAASSCSSLQGKGPLLYLKFPNAITCVTVLSENTVLFCQSTLKKVGYSINEAQTTQAFELQHYHKLGQLYEGASVLHVMKNREVKASIKVIQHVVEMKSAGQQVALLTGNKKVLLFKIDYQAVSQKMDLAELKELHELEPKLNDQFSTICFLKQNFLSNSSLLLVCGTLHGHLQIYKLVGGEAPLLYRFISQAHFDPVSCISESPLSSPDSCLFASGGYDGLIKIWNLQSRTYLYKIQICNRKISQIVWDTGAKYLLVVRDEGWESCVIVCFFSMSRSDESLDLSAEEEIRILKANDFSTNLKVAHNGTSPLLPLVDVSNGRLKVLRLEQIRKNSLKKKKVKKEEQEDWHQLIFEQNRVLLANVRPSIRKPELNQILKPMISDICCMRRNGQDEVYFSSFNGFIGMLAIKQ